MRKIYIVIIALFASCSDIPEVNHNSEKKLDEEKINQRVDSKNSIDIIKALHTEQLINARYTPNQVTSNLILKYPDEFLNTLSINKELDISDMMKKNVKAKLVLYSFSLDTIPFKDDVILIEDGDGNLRYNFNFYISTYSDNPRIKSIATIKSNWSDGNSIYDYYSVND